MGAPSDNAHRMSAAAELNSLRRGKPVLRSRARLHPLAMERRDPTITPYGDEHVAPG